VVCPSRAPNLVGQSDLASWPGPKSSAQPLTRLAKVPFPGDFTRRQNVSKSQKTTLFSALSRCFWETTALHL
jgi:hypothetical protein